MPRDGMRLEKTAGTAFYRWNIFRDYEDRFTAALSTRIGGGSSGYLAELNLGHAVGENPHILSANRSMVLKALGLASDLPWSVANQIHACRISPADPSGIPSEGTDALDVSEPGLIAAVMLADCHPIIVYDPVEHRTIIAHAGWRGTASGMAETVVQRMLENGSRIENLVAATGPGIGPCCYEVGDELRQAFQSRFDYPEAVFSRAENGSLRLDIEAANTAGLQHAGIPEKNIGRAGYCTACKTDEFYSYRNEKGLTGRHVALVALH